jgi:tetratricopeptide (TPR) repeat protein
MVQMALEELSYDAYGLEKQKNMDYYEGGLNWLRQRSHGAIWENDFQVYEVRLRENLHKQRLFGTTPQSDSDRFQIINALNRLTSEQYGVSFFDLDRLSMYSNKGDALFNERRYSEAQEEYEQAIQIFPRDLLLLKKRSDALLECRRWSDVNRVCDDAISLLAHAMEPSIAAQIYASKGKALFKMHKFDDALSAFNTAIEKQPRDAELWQPIIAQIYEEKVQELLKANKLQEAHSVLDKAIQVQTNNFKFLWDKGIIYTKQGNIEGTRNSYRDAIDLKSDNAFLHKAYGDALLNLHKAFKDALLELNLLEEAFEAYSQAIARKPDFDNAYKRRSEVCKFIAQIWLQRAKEDEERF